MMNLLLTGSSGYLGRHILYNLKKKKKYKNIICIIHSFKIYKELSYLYKNLKVYHGSIEDGNFIKKIFIENKIDCVIHCAAIKYIDICEEKMNDCINVNITGTYNLCKEARNHNVQKLITISTDKANDPTSFYGVSKLAAEKITLKYNYSVYQGVNFWNSDGSFTRIWDTAIKHNRPVILHDKRHVRYFTLPDQTAEEILNILDIAKNQIYYPASCYRIKILDVFNFLKEKFEKAEFIINDNNYKYEKIIENINKSSEIKSINIHELFYDYFKNI